ncbi:alpha/beta hydrolase [Vallitalea sp.]|jgi:alpha-beta hydrolase superfamily lysophospholipase|uniref:alpha/beta hydrolase n=1 Tax=Vallitalea sp. TaxID=1882829 RepID=UPI0025CFD237|nr:alpha/beta hydrolase [Vallitalea sp.]MCT4687017.1 alpha/beta hydrolase [Vallitalea sp.]
MYKKRIKIEGIPSVEWGEKKSHVFIAVHGNMSDKEDTVIKLLAETAVKKDYQVLSFDLAQHGERKEENTPCKVQFCVQDLKKIIFYAKQKWENISLFACSMGAYFSLLAYKEEQLEQCLFLAPVVDMGRIISNMMMWFGITPEILQKEKEIETPIGQVLYWDYYSYVKDHPVDIWDIATAILYGAKDDLCEFETIENFAKIFQCEIEIMQEGEHYFHTNEQLDVYKDWLNKYITKK